MQFEGQYVYDTTTGRMGKGVMGHLMSRQTLVEFEGGKREFVANSKLRLLQDEANDRAETIARVTGSVAASFELGPVTGTWERQAAK